MSDDTNDQPTKKLEDFGLGESATAATAATAPIVDPAQISGRTAPISEPPSLPEAEPAWLTQWNRPPERTTPRVRWAGIIWGLVFLATGWFALWTMNAPARRSAFSDWILTLNDGGWAIVAAFAIGGLLVVLGLIAALRAATRPRA